MNGKLGIIADCLPGVADIDALEKIRNAGFDMIFTGENDPGVVYKMREKCDRLGLSLDFLSENGIAPEEAMRQFFEFVGENALLVAHNAGFDMRMLRQECAKFDLEFAPQGVEVCDTLTLARYRRPDLECHALSHLIDVLGIEAVNSHDALDDTLTCAGVFFTLLQ